MLKQHPKARDVVLEGFEEHHVVDEIMGELGGADRARGSRGGGLRVTNGDPPIGPW